MRAHTANAVVEDDGIVTVGDVPVKSGQRVQVIILMPDEIPHANPYPLRGRKPFRYDRPNEPVGVEDWNVYRDDEPAR